MRKLIGIGALFLCICWTQTVCAQSYNTAFGLRLGQETGASVQQRIGKRTTIEGIAQYNKRYDESTITGLIQQHMPILFRRFNIYSGIGPHYTWSQSRELLEVESSTGITLVAGFEATIGRLNLSWDYKPLINLKGANPGFRGQSAISARYVLFKKKKKPINLKFWDWGNSKKKKKRQKAKSKKKRT